MAAEMNWIVLTNLMLSPGPAQIVDVVDASAGGRFYRPVQQ